MSCVVVACVISIVIYMLIVIYLLPPSNPIEDNFQKLLYISVMALVRWLWSGESRHCPLVLSPEADLWGLSPEADIVDVP